MTTSPEPAPAPPIFTPALVRSFDFTGWDWNKLPYGAVKAARNGNVQGSRIAGSNFCIECKRKMWSCDLAREDLCEEDDYFLRERNRALTIDRAKRNNMKPVNPFVDNDDVPRTFWPKDN